MGAVVGRISGVEVAYCRATVGELDPAQRPQHP